MTTDNQRLDRDMIDTPQMWRLIMGIGHDSIDIAITCASIDNSLIHRHIPLDTEAPTPCRALEDAIYDNPLLLSDFGSIDIVVDTPHFALLPAGTSTGTADLILSELFTDTEAPSTLTITPMPRCGAAIAMLLPADIHGFLHRTFPQLRLHHRLAPLTEYFSAHTRMGSAGKMYAHFHKGAVDIIAFGSDGLTLANTMRYRDPSDAIYYILACRRMLDTDSDSELFLSGEPALREPVTPTLREYVPYVMPAFFPASVFRAGHDAIHVPLELTVLPLCE